MYNSTSCSQVHKFPQSHHTHFSSTTFEHSVCHISLRNMLYLAILQYIYTYICMYIYIWTNKLNRYLYILHVFNYSDDVMTSYNFYSNFNILRLLQKVLLNPLQPSVAFLYPLKTFRFSDVFRGYRKAIPGCNELKRHTSSAEN